MLKGGGKHLGTYVKFRDRLNLCYKYELFGLAELLQRIVENLASLTSLRIEENHQLEEDQIGDEDLDEVEEAYKEDEEEDYKEEDYEDKEGYKEEEDYKPSDGHVAATASDSLYGSRASFAGVNSLSGSFLSQSSHSSGLLGIPYDSSF
jgi:hypothetical protein